ncbi:hypothetical protein OIU85_025496 [Salix viminalis]|uniref:Uncharacterized protein n=1 Tax=Salix viminalis TaxID=40686 RepID=A0A9Q0TLP6_SALVM|nr:hypothetical protein OIU85_025496 [Salix viminalis]
MANPNCSPKPLPRSLQFSHSWPKNTSVRPPLSHRVPPLPSAKAPDHIKWQEPEKTPQLSGHQCFICKRDLSFAPEGAGGTTNEPTTCCCLAMPPPLSCFLLGAYYCRQRCRESSMYSVCLG